VAYEQVVATARTLLRPDQLVDGVPAAVPCCRSRHCSRTAPRWCTWTRRSGRRGGRAGGGARCDGEIELAPGRERGTALLRNTGPLAIWVSSHVPLDKLNPASRSSWRRRAATGWTCRPAPRCGVEAAEAREVAVVRIGGDRA